MEEKKLLSPHPGQDPWRAAWPRRRSHWRPLAGPAPLRSLLQEDSGRTGEARRKRAKRTWTAGEEGDVLVRFNSLSILNLHIFLLLEIWVRIIAVVSRRVEQTCRRAGALSLTSSSLSSSSTLHHHSGTSQSSASTYGRMRLE